MRTSLRARCQPSWLLLALLAGCSAPAPSRYSTAPGTPVVATEEPAAAGADEPVVGLSTQDPGAASEAAPAESISKHESLHFLDDIVDAVGSGRVWVELR